MKVNLAIVTPGNGVTTEYLYSLLETIQVLLQNNISFTFSQRYSSHVADAREISLSGTKENNINESRPFEGNLDYDKILWIDSDISFTPEDVLKAYNSDFDVVSGAYLLADGTVAAYPKMLKGGLTINDVLNMSEPIEIDGAGMGFFCMKKGIFEQMERPWFGQVKAKHIDSDGNERDVVILGEDLSLCQKIRDLGYKIWLDPSIKLLHQKMYMLTWEGPRPK